MKNICWNRPRVKGNVTKGGNLTLIKVSMFLCWKYVTWIIKQYYISWLVLSTSANLHNPSLIITKFLSITYHTLYSLSVFSLAKNLQLTFEIRLTNRLVLKLSGSRLNWLVCRLHAQCIDFQEQSVMQWWHYFLQNNV